MPRGTLIFWLARDRMSLETVVAYITSALTYPRCSEQLRADDRSLLTAGEMRQGEGLLLVPQAKQSGFPTDNRCSTPA